MRKLLVLLSLAGCYTAQAQEPEIKVEQDKHAQRYRYDDDLLTPEFHAGRRQKLRDMLPNNGVAILFANPVRNRSNDVDYEYHQDPNFYYLTGFREPHAVMVVFKDIIQFDSISTNEIIFIPDRDPDAEIWNGRRLGVKSAPSVLGIKTVKSNMDFAGFDLNLDKFDKVLYLRPQRDVRDNIRSTHDLYSLMAAFDQKIEPLGKKANGASLWGLLASLRQAKELDELMLMRKAIDMTCEAQYELMKALKPGMAEYQAEAIVEYIFKKNGAEYPGFPSILGGGENSCVLHYTSNRKPLEGGNLLVSDIGAEYHGYTADVTRTLPVDGTFSPEEKIIYNLVYDAQEAGIKTCKPGARFWDPDTKAKAVIGAGLKKLGIIKNEFQVRKYFMHGTSHYLGLDVHDAGTYTNLKAGEVITVEPGIYIPEGSDCDPKWWNIGVRIEDDVLIVEDGCEVLSDCVPKKVEEIEKIMKESSKFAD